MRNEIDKSAERRSAAESPRVGDVKVVTSSDIQCQFSRRNEEQEICAHNYRLPSFAKVKAIGPRRSGFRPFRRDKGRMSIFDVRPTTNMSLEGHRGTSDVPSVTRNKDLRRFKRIARRWAVLKYKDLRRRASDSERNVPENVPPQQGHPLAAMLRIAERGLASRRKRSEGRIGNRSYGETPEWLSRADRFANFVGATWGPYGPHARRRKYETCRRFPLSRGCSQYSNEIAF
jgi:hypothetical protein